MLQGQIQAAMPKIVLGINICVPKKKGSLYCFSSQNRKKKSFIQTDGP